MNAFRLVLCLAAVGLYAAIRPARSPVAAPAASSRVTRPDAGTVSRASALGTPIHSMTQTDAVRLRATFTDRRVDAKRLSVRDQN